MTSIAEKTITEKLLAENYTTEEVCAAVGRQIEDWCRVRYKYIAKYNLKVIRVGRRYYYKKEFVDKMVEEILENGE